jgi:hypothetical protein
MAKRRKTSKKAAPAKSASLVQVAERAVLKQSNKMLVAATKRYNRFVRQAAKATNDASKRKYLAAALSAVVIAGVVANDLRGRINKRAAAPAAKKKRG